MYVTCKLNFNFSIKNIIKNRKQFNNKLCFKGKKSFLSLKKEVSSIIVNHQMKNGNFLKILKVFKKYIRKFLNSIKFLQNNNEIKKLYFLKNSFKNFDSMLIYKLIKINIMFNAKQRGSSNLIFYVKQKKRNLVVLSWIKSLINSKKLENKKKLDLKNFDSIGEFLTFEENINNIYILKLKVYRKKILFDE